MGCCWMSVSNESGNHAHLWQWLWCCACVQSSPYQTCQEMSGGGHASSRRSVSHGQVCRLVQLHPWSILSILYTAVRRWDYARVFFTPERLFQPAVSSIIPSQCPCCCLIARRDLRSHTPRQRFTMQVEAGRSGHAMPTARHAGKIPNCAQLFKPVRQTIWWKKGEQKMKKTEGKTKRRKKTGRKEGNRSARQAWKTKNDLQPATSVVP